MPAVILPGPRRARQAAWIRSPRPHLGKGYLLTGPQALTAREQVATIAEVTGRPVGFQDVTPHEFAQAAIQRGTLSEQAQLMERLNEVFRARRSVNIVETSPEQPPRPSATGPNATPARSAEARLTAHRQ